MIHTTATLKDCALKWKRTFGDEGMETCACHLQTNAKYVPNLWDKSYGFSSHLSWTSLPTSLQTFSIPVLRFGFGTTKVVTISVMWFQWNKIIHEQNCFIPPFLFTWQQMSNWETVYYIREPFWVLFYSQKEEFYINSMLAFWFISWQLCPWLQSWSILWIHQIELQID